MAACGAAPATIRTRFRTLIRKIIRMTSRRSQWRTTARFASPATPQNFPPLRRIPQKIATASPATCLTATRRMAATPPSPITEFSAAPNRSPFPHRMPPPIPASLRGASRHQSCEPAISASLTLTPECSANLRKFIVQGYRTLTEVQAQFSMTAISSNGLAKRCCSHSKPAEAKIAFERALQLDPNSPLAEASAASPYVASGDAAAPSRTWSARSRSILYICPQRAL